MQKKYKELLIQEKEFREILSRVSLEVDGLELELPLSEAEMRRQRIPKRKHIET